jgi:hypothetical protein
MNQPEVLQIVQPEQDQPELFSLRPFPSILGPRRNVLTTLFATQPTLSTIQSSAGAVWKVKRGNLELLGRRQIGRRNRILLRDFRPSGAKNDPSDAKLLLDILILCF